ncbi:hypothetical protein K4F52_007097 [Lecanicillium sp. MT-2017a]|nr:hypothetical protein K4F52_007097 [Lecanicillium sp. MT-2017a]
MKSNTTRLPNEADASQTDGVSTAHIFTGPPAGREQLQGQFMTRLPPAPPLTPPELSSTIYSAGEDRQAGVDSFINQPNPDYLSVSEPMPMDSIATPAPRRRSHMTTMPMPIPTPQSSSLSARGGSSPEQACTSHSYPPSSPILPPAPPEDPEVTSEGDFSHRNVDVRGEIISVLDGDGAGWTRHTRVYGGGVCLACSAAGGGHEGGFYGATVTPEEMR